MYVVNPEAIDKNKLYECNGIIANYLKERGFVFLSKKDGKWIFMKTDKLLEVLSEMPFYYNISKIIW